MSQWDAGPSKFYVAIWGLRIITKLVSKKCAKHAIKNELKSSNHAENDRLNFCVKPWKPLKAKENDIFHTKFSYHTSLFSDNAPTERYRVNTLTLDFQMNSVPFKV